MGCQLWMIHTIYWSSSYHYNEFDLHRCIQNRKHLIDCNLNTLIFLLNLLSKDLFCNLTYIPLTLHPRRGSRGILYIPPRCPRFTTNIQLWVILQTWQVVSPSPSDGSPLQMTCCYSFSCLLRHPWKKERGAILLFL
jgi:hypothetical protein